MTEDDGQLTGTDKIPDDAHWGDYVAFWRATGLPNRVAYRLAGEGILSVAALKALGREGFLRIPGLGKLALQAVAPLTGWEWRESSGLAYLGTDLMVTELRRRGWTVTPPAPASFVCPLCDGQSYHPRDIAERFCGRCGFVDDVMLQRRLEAEVARRAAPHTALASNTGGDGGNRSSDPHRDTSSR